MQKLKNRVYRILELHPETRNCDATLVAKYWQMYEAKNLDSHGTFLELSMLKHMTSPSAIERLRRKIQQEGRFWPTDEKVVRRRRMNMDKWKEMMIALTPDTL